MTGRRKSDRPYSTQKNKRNKNIKNIFDLQIERELILSSDKASSKIPLMHEVRNTPSGPRRTAAALLPRQTGAIAPDHPPKQLQAWVSSIFEIKSIACDAFASNLSRPLSQNYRIDFW